MAQFLDVGRSSSYVFLFWDNYTKLSQLLLDYVAAKRDGNKHLEVEAFAEMIPYDFMCGHINYARWGIIDVSEKKILMEEKPDIFQALERSQSAIHHTMRPFSGIWQDMAIEQSINRHCGKYMHLSTGPEALNKYYLTAHLKATVVNLIEEMCGMNEANDAQHKEATHSRINKDESAVQKIYKLISDQMVNPFVIEDRANPENRQPLVNIATSIAAPDNVAISLSSIKENGTEEMSTFVEKRVSTGEIDFFSPIEKPQLLTFTSMNKPLVSKQKQAVQAVRIDREIFGKPLVIGQSREIPIQELMKYELASVPLTLFCLNGSLRKTVKSAALEWLEADTAVPDLLRNFQGKTLYVIDFMMLLQMSCRGSTDCRTFGGLSDKPFRKVFQPQYQYVVVVGDNYKVKLSMKGVECTRRGSTQIHEIRSPSRNTPLPKQRQKMLFNQKNKINISNFIMSDWIRKGEAELEQDRYLYLSGGFSDTERAVCVTNGRHTEVDALQSDHEEADSLMFVHIHHAMETFSPERVVLWSIDTDVAIMCPYHVFKCNIAELFFKTGVSQRQ